MAPVSSAIPTAKTESVVVVVNALVGVGGEAKVTTSGVVMMLSARVTVPVARARPSIEPPAPTVMAPLAMMFPENDEDAPVPAAPFTCQNTLDAWAPLIRLTVLEAVVLSAASTWKMNTAFGLPCPSNVRVPVSANAEAV